MDAASVRTAVIQKQVLRSLRSHQDDKRAYVVNAILLRSGNANMTAAAAT